MKNIYEIFEEFVMAKSKKDKINILRQNDSSVLRNVLKAAFNPTINFVIREAVQYRKSDSPPGMGYSNMATEMDKIYIFIENGVRVNPNLRFERKKQILIQMLEALEAKEANVFMNMLLKDLKVEGLTAPIVNEAFPDF